MTMHPMFKKCPKCKRKFTYNPSVGDLGLICPHCKAPVIATEGITKPGGYTDKGI